MRVPTAPVVAGSLIGGYYVARTTRVRALGGAVLAVGGSVAEREWAKHAGPVNAAILGGDTETGNSVITLAERMDAGQILGTSKREIDPLMFLHAAEVR